MLIFNSTSTKHRERPVTYHTKSWGKEFVSSCISTRCQLLHAASWRASPNHRSCAPAILRMITADLGTCTSAKRTWHYHGIFMQESLAMKANLRTPPHMAAGTGILLRPGSMRTGPQSSALPIPAPFWSPEQVGNHMDSTNYNTECCQQASNELELWICLVENPKPQRRVGSSQATAQKTKS